VHGDAGRGKVDEKHLDGGVIELNYADPVAVKVVKELKGDVGDEILISTDLMCYRSFSVGDFAVGETFVFPIVHTTENGLHILPSCSHSALKLVDGQLYTNELTAEGGRHLEVYMSLTLFRLLMPVGILDRRVQFAGATGLVLLVAMIVTSRVRRRNANEAPIARPASPLTALRSVRWRSGFAVAWMLLCAGCCVLVGMHEWHWVPWLLGALFALAAAGIALRWRWSEGLAYGLGMVWIGTWCALGYLGVSGYFTAGHHLSRKAALEVMFVDVAATLLCIAGMIWCTDAIRRRFSAAST
jgi:hypothetical protein